MKRLAVALLATAIVLIATAGSRLDAQGKYRPCSLLQVAELQTVLEREVDDGIETEVALPDGPYRGETLAECRWIWEGSSPSSVDFALLKIIRIPQNAQQTAYWRNLTGVDLIARGLGLGAPAERGKVGDADCVGARARDPRARSVVGCSLERKGLALWLELGGNPAVFKATLQQVGGLMERAASRLP